MTEKCFNNWWKSLGLIDIVDAYYLRAYEKTINADRLLQNLRERVQFVDTADGGVSRPALSAKDVAIRQWFWSMIEGGDFEYQIDGAGNQLLLWIRKS